MANDKDKGYHVDLAISQDMSQPSAAVVLSIFNTFLIHNTVDE